VSDLLPLRLRRRRPGLIRPTLERVEAAAAALGHPERDLDCIRIAGTNGKGSTAAMLAAILSAHGLRAGLFTSPHLVHVEERFQISATRISSSELDALLARLDSFPDLSFFETLALAAMLWFASSGVDVAVLEVGLGGRWDATRLAPARIAGLTNIGSDHAQWLGSTREKIAREKAAALADARVAILGPEIGPDLPPMLNIRAAVAAGDLVRITNVGTTEVTADWDDGPIGLSVPLAGRHQVANLHLALALARAAERDGLIRTLDADAVRCGLAAVHWPGRLSKHTIRGREVLLDGAHNLEAVQALVAHLERSETRYNLLFSCLDDKPLEAMAERLRPVVGEIAVFPLDGPRAAPIDRIAAAFPGARPARSAREGLAMLPDPVLASGSLRVVGSLLQ